MSLLDRTSASLAERSRPQKFETLISLPEFRFFLRASRLKRLFPFAVLSMRYWWWPLRPRSCPPTSTVQYPGNASLSTARRQSSLETIRSRWRGRVHDDPAQGGRQVWRKIVFADEFPRTDGDIIV